MSADTPDTPPASTTLDVARWTVFRPVATLMVVVAVAVFGYLSYAQLPVNLMPELSYPTLTVRTELTGAAPEEVEENLTTPIEEIVRTVEGVVGVSSVSRAGQSDVVLRFAWDSDMDYATQKVRERLELVQLPDDVESPMLLRYDPALDPILRVGLSGDADLAELRRLAEEEVERSLEKVEGVAMLKVRGGLEEIVRVDLDPGRMAMLGVTAAQVAERLSAENVNLAGGALAEGDVTYLVRTLNAFEGIDEIEDLIVAYPAGQPVRLSQIAKVRRGVREREVITRLGSPDGMNGTHGTAGSRPTGSDGYQPSRKGSDGYQPSRKGSDGYQPSRKGSDGYQPSTPISESVVIEVYKEADANLVDVAARVRDDLWGDASDRATLARQLATSRAGAVASRARLIASGGEGRADAAPRPAPPYVEARLPEGVQLTLLNDQSTFIQNAIDEVASTALWGAVFAVLVLFVFLRNVWTTVIIAVAIPLSVVAAFGALRLAGVSLNVMSLGGIALGVGMLVDNSIVVLESIFRCREEGDSVVDAALRGTGEVAGAVVASTLTTIAVFFPIVFVEGIAGQIFGDLAMSVVFALLASLAVSLFFVPMLASRPGWEAGEIGRDPRAALGLLWRAPSAPAEALADARAYTRGIRDSAAFGRAWRLLLAPVVFAFLLARALVVTLLELIFARLFAGIVALLLVVAYTILTAVTRLLRRLVGGVFGLFDRGYGGLERAYRPLLRGALRARGAVVLVALLLFGWSVWQFERLGTELLPTMHQGEFDVELTMPVGTRLEETSRAAARLEQALVDIEGIERFASTIGTERTNVQQSDEGEHTARITVRLAPDATPQAAEARVMAEVRRAAGRIPGATAEIRRPSLFAVQTPLEVQVEGENLRLLRETSDRVYEALATMGELADVRSNLGRGFPEVQVRFDRDRLAALGLTARGVGDAIRDQVRGLEPTEIRERDVDLSILVRTDPGEIPDVESLETVVVRPRTDELPEIRLASVAELELSVGPSEIRHVDGRRAAVVEADVPLTSLSGAAAAVQRRLASVDLPPGMSVRIAGQSQQMDQARDSLLFALGLAVFLVYIVLASKFESFRGPFVILLSIPLALVGVVAALSLLEVHVSVLVFIGLIMLAGIVVNNAIVLVDYINQLRERGEPLDQAIVEASRIRLRPVLITTLTTVLGLLPMAMGLGEGAELRRPMAITVIAGLASATLLTLVVVPVLYRLMMRRT